MNIAYNEGPTSTAKVFAGYSVCKFDTIESELYSIRTYIEYIFRRIRSHDSKRKKKRKKVGATNNFALELVSPKIDLRAKRGWLDVLLKNIFEQKTGLSGRIANIATSRDSS